MNTEIVERLDQASELFETGKSEKAIEVSNEILSREPANSSALWIKANALIRLDRPDDAIAVYDAAAKADPGAAAALLMSKSDQLEWLGRLDEAIEATAHAVRLEPGHSEYRSQYISLLRRSGRLPEALSECDQALQLLDSRPEFLEVKAGILRDLERYQEAFILLSEQADRFTAEDWTRWADDLRYGGNNREALRYYRQAIDLKPSLAAALRGEGLSLYSEKQVEAALASFERAAEADPKDDSAWIHKGNIHLDLRQFTEAEDCYRRALGIDANSVYANLNLAILYENSERYELAIEKHRRALEIDPNLVDAMLGLAWCLEVTGQLAEAAQVSDRALALQPTLSKVQNLKGYILLRQGLKAEAIEYFDRAMAAADWGSDVGPIFNKATVLRELGRYGEVETLYRQSLAKANTQDRARLLGGLGALLAEAMGKPSDAHACFVEAHSISGGTPESTANLAESFLRMGQYATARKYGLEAHAQYHGPSVCGALGLIVLASFLLEGDFTSAARSFVELEANLRAAQNASGREWDFSSLIQIAQGNTVDRFVRFMLLTLIDVHSKKAPVSQLSFFAETVNTVPMQEASAVAS